MLFKSITSVIVCAGALLGLAITAIPAQGQDTELSKYDEAVFFFGGRFHDDWFGSTFRPWEVRWDDTYIAAIGYQRTLLDWNDLRLGAELGLAGRFGVDGSSAELWAGGFIRYDGFVVADTVRISPSFTIGLSAATGTQGHEGARMAEWGKPTPVLVYLGPELNLSLVDQPQWEAFARIQHRSGAYGLIADLDASNALTLGLRYKY